MNSTPLTFNARLRFDLIHRLLPSAADSFLEVGCGEGALGSWLAGKYEYVGYEPDPESCSRARQRIGKRGVVENESLPREPCRTFDVVGAFEVLEHLEEDEQALRSWRDWLKPGGVILLSVPAHPTRFGPADVMAGHYRRYRREELNTLLRRIGFCETIVWSYGFPLGYLLEFGRNRLAGQSSEGSLQERTASSGRKWQVRDDLWWLPAVATAPFRLLQRPFRDTDLGTGLVARCQKPG